MADIQTEMNNSPEPKVIKEVFDEVKKLGDNWKSNYEELRKNYEELKKDLDTRDQEDGLVKEKITKLSEDISTRQQLLDEKVKEVEEKSNERVDSIEVSLQRIGKEGTEEDFKKRFKEANQFLLEARSVKSVDGNGVPFGGIKKEEISVEQYKAYCDSFEKWIRKYGGNNQLMMSPEDIKALSEGVDPDGGYTVTPAMSSRVVNRIFETDPLRQLAGVESITTNALEFMVDWGQAGYGWETETAAGDETTTPDFRKKRIPVHIMYAKPRATQTLLEDSGINVESWLADKVADRFSRAEAAAFVTGDGVGKPRGFLTYDNGTDYGQVEQVNMGAAAALTADGFVDVKYALKEFYLERGTWLMNRSTVAAAMKLKDGSGEYIWKPSMIAGDPSSSILNLPVRMATTMPTVAANALSVALADWRESYLIVDRLGITVQRDPYTVKPFVEFYTRKRVGGDVVNYEAIKIGKISA